MSLLELRNHTRLSAIFFVCTILFAVQPALRQNAAQRSAVILMEASPVSISLTPSTATLTPSQAQQFTAKVGGASKTNVTWTLSPALGTISTGGLYKAPASIAVVQTVTVKATSVADPTKSTSATITFAPPVTVSLTPLSATLTVSQPQQFTATVGGSSNGAVTWTLNHAAGAISAAGLYTAPAMIATAQQVTVKASSMADPTKSSSATVTLTPLVSVSLTPLSATLTASQTQQFKAMVAGASNTKVTWTLSSAVGTVSAAGLYKAPATIGAAQSVTVKATSAADPTKSASATITLSPVGISLSPLSASLSLAQTQRFTAKVVGSNNSEVTWTLSPAVGTISSAGFYTAPATIGPVRTITVTAASVADPTKSASAGITLLLPSSPFILTTSPLPVAPSGAPYSQTLAVTGTAPITWSVTNGKLPTGLSLTLSTGVIGGTPTEAGLFTPTITATNAGGSASKQLSLTVNVPMTSHIGINMSEAEYSWGSFPGESDLAFIKSNNISLIRLPIAWERAQPVLGGSLDPAYLSALKTFISAAGAQGIEVIVDVHNYGRYNSHWAEDAAANYGYVGPGNGDVIGSPAVPVSAIANLWRELAIALERTPGLGYYDIMNEPHDMGAADVWPTAAQAAVNAIRSVDMITPILVEGDQWASAAFWPQVNGNLHVTDPANKLLYEAHQYFDADASSNYAQSYAQQGAYPNIGVDRLQPFLTWLRQNNAQGFLGEFGVPNNDPKWLTVLDNFLTASQAAGLSGTYWSYVFHAASDPPFWPVNLPLFINNNGQANPQMDILVKHNGAYR